MALITRHLKLFATDSRFLPRCSTAGQLFDTKCGPVATTLENRNIWTSQEKSATAQAVAEVAGDADSVKEFSEIPGPRPLPFVGNKLYIMTHRNFDPTNIYQFWESLINEFGPIVKLQMGKRHVVGTMCPNDLEKIMKSTLHNPIRHAFSSLKKVRVDDKDNFFNKKSGILPENGEEWWRVRSKVQAPLLRPKNVALYLPLVDQVTVKFMERIDLLQADNGRVPDDFLQELYKWTLECIGLVALNTELGCLDPNLAEDSLPTQLIQLTNEFFEALSAAERGIQTWKYYKTKNYIRLENAHSSFRKLTAAAIEEAEQKLKEAAAAGDSKKGLTILETFLNTEGLSRTDILTITLDLFFAGIETTAHTVAFALYLLSHNMELQKRLQQQIDEVVSRDEPLTNDHLLALNCITHTVRETLRLYPQTFGTPRVLTEDLVLSGYKVPAGTLAFAFNMLMCRKEENFTQPMEFIPERWQRDRPHGYIHPYASIPFSTGPRMCIGKRMAEQESNTFLIRLLQKYTVTFESDEEMKVKTQIALKPATALRFKFHPRQ